MKLLRSNLKTLEKARTFLTPWARLSKKKQTCNIMRSQQGPNKVQEAIKRKQCQCMKLHHMDDIIRILLRANLIVLPR